MTSRYPAALEEGTVIVHSLQLKTWRYVLITAILELGLSDRQACILLMNTSASYTYLLLLLMSTVHFVVITSCVFRRTGVCCDGKIS